MLREILNKLPKDSKLINGGARITMESVSLTFKTTLALLTRL